MWYIILSRSLPEKEESKQQNYEEHRQWLDEQHQAGRLLFSGPTADRAYGIYIMLASDKSEAERIAAEDRRDKAKRDKDRADAAKRADSLMRFAKSGPSKKMFLVFFQSSTWIAIRCSMRARVFGSSDAVMNAFTFVPCLSFRPSRPARP